MLSLLKNFNGRITIFEDEILSKLLSKNKINHTVVSRKRDSNVFLITNKVCNKLSGRFIRKKHIVLLINIQGMSKFIRDRSAHWEFVEPDVLAHNKRNLVITCNLDKIQNYL